MAIFCKVLLDSQAEICWDPLSHESERVVRLTWNVERYRIAGFEGLRLSYEVPSAALSTPQLSDAWQALVIRPTAGEEWDGLLEAGS